MAKAVDKLISSLTPGGKKAVNIAGKAGYIILNNDDNGSPDYSYCANKAVKTFITSGKNGKYIDTID